MLPNPQPPQPDDWEGMGFNIVAIEDIIVTRDILDDIRSRLYACL